MGTTQRISGPPSWQISSVKPFNSVPCEICKISSLFLHIEVTAQFSYANLLEINTRFFTLLFRQHYRVTMGFSPSHQDPSRTNSLVLHVVSIILTIVTFRCLYEKSERDDCQNSAARIAHQTFWSLQSPDDP